MHVYTLDPLRDSRWRALVATHPGASVFHTTGWLEALQRTYGYEPIVYTTCPPGDPLANGIVVCRVTSWLTGNRLVSVPFADHCNPLVDSPEAADAIVAALRDETRRGWKYVELRGAGAGAGIEPSMVGTWKFGWHRLDLHPAIDVILRRMHPGSIQRKIRRAEREGLRYEEGRSAALLESFFRLLVSTRKRHGVPPPPLRWFANLVDCLGAAVKIRVATKEGRAIGAILTLQHRATLVYKYGGSDASVHSLGTMPFLFWRTIEEAKSLGLLELDLGRSDPENTGLITFKERLGAAPATLTYMRCPASPRPGGLRTARMPPRLFAWCPACLSAAAGRLLYRHIG